MKKYIPLVLIIFGLVVNMFFLKNIFVGSILTLLYFAVIGVVNAESIDRVIGIRNKIVKYVLGIGISLLFFGFLLSIAVVWYKLPIWLLCLFFVFFAFGSIFLRKKVVFSFPILENNSEITVFGIFPKRKFIFFCFIAVSFLQVLILYLCRTTSGIESPWQVIHPWYLYNFFLLTFLLLVIILSRVSLTAKLFCIVLYSLLLHLYLPVTHINPWGGDVWRLMGVEGKLLSGGTEPPGFPTAFVNPYKYTYGQVWGLVTGFAQSTGISLLELHRWGMAILWGLMLPAFMFVFGKKVFASDKYALFFAFLSAFPFAFQAIGSITVAVSLGFLSFLFGLLLLLSYFEDKNLLRKKLCFGFGLFMIFGYALFAILYWLLFGIFLLIQKYSDNGHFDFKKLSSLQKCFGIGVVLALLVLFPVIDAFVGESRVISNFSLFTSLKQSIGQFLAWYFARPIGEGEIASANIFFNHMHLPSYVKSIFTTLRLPMVFCMILMFIFVLRGMYTSVRKEKNILSLSLIILFVSVFVGYILGWYFLQGDRIFVRRLDAPIALLFLVFFLYGVFSCDFKEWMRSWSKKKVYISLFTLIFFYSFVATTIYASGPDIRVVSRDEYLSAEYLARYQESGQNACVLADTWILLPLEGLSRGTVVGGGFPIGANFGQAERVELYNEFLKNPDARIIPKIFAVVPSESCFVVVSQNDIDPRKEVLIHELLGNAVMKFGDILIWKMELKK